MKAADACCAAFSRSSVVVIVVGEGGEIDIDPSVTYSLDGGPEQAATCSVANALGDCIAFNAGEDEPGAYEVTAQADGYAAASETLTVDWDAYGCNVETQTVRLTLPLDAEEGAP